ncbi:MAG: mevalonate kinase [Anaerolineae bacterium]|nr:mevalonate kinase [Anaerolineae bacterium]
MTQLQATAPGKVILFGEHAVVYNRPAIAVPVLKVRAKAELEPSADLDGLQIIAPDLGRHYRLSEAEADDALAMIIRSTLAYLKQPHPPRAALTVSSTIPLGRGLGSGAAISTAIARVVARFYGCELTPAELSTLVYEVEKLYHGTPSGIDNTVVAFAQPVYFVRQQPIERMVVARPFTLVVGDTGRVSPTHKAVGYVRRQWQADPEGYERYFDAAGRIAAAAREIIEQGQSIIALGRLMDENQTALEAIGVSSPELEQLIQAARRAGALGAKLSGAGWGGNMIALVESQPEVIEAVTRALTKAGASGVIVTEVGGIHHP